MGLHARERRKLHQIEEGLRKDDPALDVLLAGRPSPRWLVPGSWRFWALLTGYLVPPALVSAGLLLHAATLVLAGAALFPLAPVITWLLIRRSSHPQGTQPLPRTMTRALPTAIGRARRLHPLSGGAQRC